MPDKLYDAAGRPQPGRLLQVPEDVQILAPRWRLKEWHYVSLATPDLFVALAVVQLGYVANAFVYAVDRRTGRLRQMDALMPLGRGLQFAPHPQRDTTTWRHGRDNVTLAGRPDGWDVNLDVQLQDVRLQGTLALTTGEPLALGVELAPGRLAFTWKDAGLPARYTLQLGDQTHEGEGLATSDWTRGHFLRTTRWHWASCVHTLPDGRRLGLNLSAAIYGDVEDALWLDGKLQMLAGVQFRVPEQADRQPWTITGEGIDLTFTPQGARRQDVNLGVVRSRFVQPYGKFAGTVAGVRLDDAFGVVEDHLSVW